MTRRSKAGVRVAVGAGLLVLSPIAALGGISAGMATLPAPASPVVTVAVDVALAQLGMPYQWGGEEPSTGFDCSGLVQYAYERAGLALPRTAQQQYDAGPRLPVTSPPQPGDLVFFGRSGRSVTHVGLALGEGRMVDAPHTGALVRVEPIAGFGHYLGATRPVGSSQPDPAA